MLEHMRLFTLLGLVVSSVILYRILVFVWIYFLRTTSIDKYSVPVNNHQSWALITGASDGIGLETARSLLRRNFNVILHGRNPIKLSGIVDDLQGRFPSQGIAFIVADAIDAIPSSQKVAREVQQILTKSKGVLRVLVNNIGGSNMFGFRTFHFVDEAPDDLSQKIIALNLTFPSVLTHLLLTTLQEHKAPSLVINIGSMAGLSGIPLVSMYSACKAANMAFSNALASEMVIADSNVEVLGIIVGEVVSGATHWFMNDGDWAVVSSKQMAEDVLGRVGCGMPVVVGNWRQAVIGAGLSITPGWMMRKVTMGMMRERREREDRNM
jgi:17beta-estradiol 17-dehydrogenase / very-long-chain 3-oxoacyl-CoA reductase